MDRGVFIYLRNVLLYLLLRISKVFTAFHLFSIIEELNRLDSVQLLYRLLFFLYFFTVGLRLEGVVEKVENSESSVEVLQIFTHLLLVFNPSDCVRVFMLHYNLHALLLERIADLQVKKTYLFC